MGVFRSATTRCSGVNASVCWHDMAVFIIVGADKVAPAVETCAFKLKKRKSVVYWC